jgi:hypothetical protein
MNEALLKKYSKLFLVLKGQLEAFDVLPKAMYYFLRH